jgi:hypothetical protein
LPQSTKVLARAALAQDLLTHIHHLRSGATESEVVVREITRDIRSLDTSKKNIVSAMTGVKRFQMLGAPTPADHQLSLTGSAQSTPLISLRD